MAQKQCLLEALFSYDLNGRLLLLFFYSAFPPIPHFSIIWLLIHPVSFCFFPVSHTYFFLYRV